jgi:hypothetical protein
MSANERTQIPERASSDEAKRFNRSPHICFPVSVAENCYTEAFDEGSKKQANK